MPHSTQERLFRAFLNNFNNLRSTPPKGAPPTKHNHHVPKTFLEGFFEKGETAHVLHKTHPEVVLYKPPVSLKRLCAMKDLYSFPASAVGKPDRTSLEHLFGVLESWWPEFKQRLSASEPSAPAIDLRTRTSEEHFKLSLFLAQLVCRSPKAMSLHPGFRNSQSGEAALASLELCENIAWDILELSWILYYSKDGYIIGDAPFCAPTKTSTLFPLSRHWALEVSRQYESSFQVMQMGPTEAINNQIFAMARRYVVVPNTCRLYNPDQDDLIRTVTEPPPNKLFDLRKDCKITYKGKRL